ncbi:MAG TPA: DNA mismatch repair endonuclease MutL [Clostridiales bacterium]|nr:DNA mismatch repair endonuclease MutL [Clostridiales bacterium]
MSLIQVLDESTINQIAAGEVVERPSAVVKELIENAVDAGATAITAEIKEGGLSFIRITDNGCGIAKEDVPLAFLRHATSKIRSAQDLLSVTSLGFRGEALSSISAVAQVELITKTPTALNGFRYIIEGGEEKTFEEIGSPAGTTIIVRNIFYNTPARRKFLKSAMTEANYISDLMERLIVSHPNVAFKFIANNQVKLQSSGNNSTRDILYSIYGRDISRELLPVELDTEDVKVTGFIGKPTITRGNRNFENYFINGRYIKSNIITKAIEEAYKPFLMQHKYPFTSIYFEIDPSHIDVNVHPQKLEIRLNNGEAIYQLTYNLIRNALLGKEMIPKVALTPQPEEKKPVTAGMPEPFEQNRRNSLAYHYPDRKEGAYTPHKVAEKPTDYITATKPLINPASPLSEALAGAGKGAFDNHRTMQEAYGSTPGNMAAPASGADKNGSGAPAGSHQSFGEYKEAHKEEYKSGDGANNKLEPLQQPMDVGSEKAEQLKLFSEETTQENAPFLSEQAAREHRIIGQVFSTYWLVEYKKELYIIDQHAAHEKVLYEKLMRASREKTFSSQQLLPPIVLSLTLKEQEILHKHEAVLSSIGYEFEHFGGKEYSVRAVPADLFSISEKELLLEFIDALGDEATGGSLASVSILERAASLSCKAAVKANHAFSFEEATALINELLTLENPYHCPHGRPVIVSMSQYELERKFKRIL